MRVNILDLKFMGEEKLIGAFLVSDGSANVLVECGPDSCFPRLEGLLSSFGLKTKDLDAVLPTHVHLDHAGAAWRFAAEGVPVAFHPFGARHMADPERLYASAKRIYLDRMEELWGRLEKIPASRIVVPEDGETLRFGGLGFEAVYTPGHAKHHIAWRHGDAVFTGDVAGGKIDDGPIELQTPPPDIDLEAWEASAEKLLRMRPKKLFLTHFGRVDNAEGHLNQVRTIAGEIAESILGIDPAGEAAREELKALVAKRKSAAFFSETGGKRTESGLFRKYALINPDEMSAQGLRFYLSKRP